MQISRRALAEQDARWLKLPLPDGGDPAPVAAHLRHLARLMGAERRASAVAAAAHWGQLYDRSVPQGFNLACRAGCAHCCSQTVLVYAPEAFRVAAQVSEHAATKAAMRQAAVKLGEPSSAPGMGPRMLCPLLSNSQCSIYEARPINCRAFVAVDVRECISTFVMMGKFAVRMPAPITNLRTFCHMLIMAALRLTGKKVALYEMNAAVGRILATPEAEQRWLSGEDIFAGLAQDVPIAPEIDAGIERLIALVGPTMVRT